MQTSIVLKSEFSISRFIGCHILFKGVGTDTMHPSILLGTFLTEKKASHLI